MSDTEKLKDMLDNLIDQRSEQAQVNFHEYLQGKMSEILNPENPDSANKNNKE
jgi:hypothetical protein